MQYTFIIIKFIFNILIFISLYNILIKYKVLNFNNQNNSIIFVNLNKISSIFQISSKDIFLISKLLVLVFLRNILLLIIIKNNLYYNPYILVWSFYDLISFLIYGTTYVCMLFILGSEFESIKLLNILTNKSNILKYFDNIKLFPLRIFSKFFLVIVIYNILFYLVNFIPHISY